MKLKRVYMPDDVIKAIQEHADLFSAGNFSASVRFFIEKGFTKESKDKQSEQKQGL